MTKKPLKIKGETNSRTRLGTGTEDGAVTATIVEVQKEIIELPRKKTLYFGKHVQNLKRQQKISSL